MRMVIAYHGTAADPETIRREGLKPVTNYLGIANALLEEFEDRYHLPKWAYEHVGWEIRYRERQEGKGGVHLTLSWRQAAAYAGTVGGEFRQLVRDLLLRAVGRKGKWEKSTKFVVKCRILLDDETLKVKNTLAEHNMDWREHRECGGWDIMVEYVPPENILEIEQVKEATLVNSQ